MKKNKIHRLLLPVLIAAVVVFSSGVGFVNVAMAASLSPLSDTQSDNTTAVLTSNDIKFTTVTTIPSSGTITFTYSNSTSLSATLNTSDLGLYIGGATSTIVSGAATSSAWGMVRTSSTVYTLTAPSSGSTTANTIELKIGSAAGGTNRITNGSVGTTLLTIATSAGDSGTIGIPIIAAVSGNPGDQVTITATVNPTISFSVSNNSLYFGTLSSGSTVYAASSTGGSTTDTATATSLTIATNAVNGYTLTYNGTTLTNGSYTIPPYILCGTTTGTAGTSQFGMSAAFSGTPTGTLVNSYNHANTTTGTTGTTASPTTANTCSGGAATNPNWDFVAGTPATLATASAPVAGDTLGVRFIANVSPTQPAGTYTAAITYIATGNY